MPTTRTASASILMVGWFEAKRPIGLVSSIIRSADTIAAAIMIRIVNFRKRNSNQRLAARAFPTHFIHTQHYIGRLASSGSHDLHNTWISKGFAETDMPWVAKPAWWISAGRAGPLGCSRRSICRRMDRHAMLDLHRAL